MCFKCSKEPSHRDGSFEYPQHVFWLRNKKIIFSCALLSGGLLTLDKIGKVSISLTGTRSSKDRIGRLLRYDSSSAGLKIKTRGGSTGYEEVYRIKSKNT